MLAAMRILDTRDTINRAIALLANISGEQVTGVGGDPVMRIVIPSSLAGVLGELAEAPLGDEVRKRVSVLMKLPLLQTSGRVSAPSVHWQVFAEARQNLLLLLQPIVNALSSAATPVPDGGVLVKLPAVENLDDMAKVLSQLSRAFDQLLHRVNEPPLQTVGVESGSAWLVLAVRTLGAFNVLSTLMKALNIVLHAVTQFRAQTALFEELKVEAGHRKKQEELNREMQNALILRVGNELAENPTGREPRVPDQELIRICVESVKTLQELSTRGAEVRLLAIKNGPTVAPDVATLSAPPAPPAQIPETTPGDGNNNGG